MKYDELYNISEEMKLYNISGETNFKIEAKTAYIEQMKSSSYGLKLKSSAPVSAGICHCGEELVKKPGQPLYHPKSMNVGCVPAPATSVNPVHYEQLVESGWPSPELVKQLAPEGLDEATVDIVRKLVAAGLASAAEQVAETNKVKKSVQDHQQALDELKSAVQLLSKYAKFGYLGCTDVKCGCEESNKLRAKNQIKEYLASY